MTIALRGTPTQAADYANSQTVISYPTGHVSGDVLVLMAAHAYTFTGFYTPTDWTLLLNDTRSSGPYKIDQSIYWRVDDGTLGSSLTLVHQSGGGGMAIMYAFSGASTSTPAAAQYGSLNAESATVDFPALGSWASGNGYDLTFGAFNAIGHGMTDADPSGYTAGPSATEDFWGRSHASHKALSSVTTVGALSATWSASYPNVGAHIFIKEPAEAGGGTLFLMLEDNSGSYELEDGSGGTLLES